MRELLLRTHPQPYILVKGNDTVMYLHGHYGLWLGPEYYVLVIVTNSHEGEFVTTWH